MPAGERLNVTVSSRDLFWPVVLVLMLTDFIASLEASMIFGAMPTISREYGSYASAGWLISSFVLVQAVAAAIGGRLGDLLGRRRVLILVLLLSGIGSLISALMEPFAFVLLGRCIQGVSGAILPLSFGIIREHSDQQRASFGVGLVVGAYSVSGALGFVLGGYFADLGSWRLIFYVTTALPAAVALLIYLIIPRSPADPEASRRIDYIGAATLAPAVAIFLLGVTNSSTQGLGSPMTWGFLLGGLLLLLFWVWHELRTAAPLINLRRLREPSIALSITSFFLLGCGGLQMALVILALMQQPLWTGIGLGLSGAVAGLAKLPSNVAGVFAGPAGGKIAQRFSSRTAALCGYGVLAVAWLLLLFSGTSLSLVMAGAIGSSIGVTIAMVATPALIMEVTPSGETSEATGLAYLVRAIGMGVGAQIVAVLLATSSVMDPTTGADFPSPAAFQLAIGFVLAMTILALILTMIIPRASSRQGEQAAATAASV